METKVLNCTHQNEEVLSHRKMQHALGRMNHNANSTTNNHSTQTSSSSDVECSRRGSVPTLLRQSLFHYLLSQRRYSGIQVPETNITDHQPLSELENECHYESRPLAGAISSHRKSSISGFAFWIPTVQASSPNISSLPSFVSSGSSSSEIPVPKDSCTGSDPANCRSLAPSSTTTTTSGASTVATSTNSSNATAGSASAHCLAANSSVFTCSALPSPSSTARVNLMSNSAVAVQQNSFLHSLTRLATLAQPFTPPSPVTIKLITNSSGNLSTQLEEKKQHLEKAAKTETTALEQNTARTRHTPAVLPPPAEQHRPRYPHRHSQIYDSFDQQVTSSPSSSSSSSPSSYHHHQQSSSITFHPQVIPKSDHHSHDFYFSLIHHQFHQLTLAEKERFERLFREIDINGNGYIDFNDLVHTLEAKGIKATQDNVKHVIERSDTNLDGDIDFAEFVTYCLQNEKKLHVLFKDIDLNDDGKIDEHELVAAFEKAGVEVNQQEVLKLVHRIKEKNNIKDGEALELDFEEFRDYLLLHPTDSLHHLMQSWRHGTFVDLGEDGLMPVDFSENEIKSGMWWRHLVAGGVAGAVSRTATAPLDRLKVFLQVRGAEFNGLGVCLRHMIQEGGVISLWRGNGINVLKIAPETAIKFMAFDQMKRWIHSSKSGDITVIERFLAGSAAGAISQTVIYPMEVLKTRFCLRSTGQYSGLLDAARKINANGGLRNFYRGYVPNLLGIIPYAGIDLTIYETLKKTYLLHNSMEEAPIYVCLACGTISSTFGQIASYPLALVRTRMQSESGFHRSSMLGMLKSIYSKEGPKGLYRGITANIMKVAPAVSISYVVYEYTRRPLGAIMS